jgi:hypothetical protein
MVKRTLAAALLVLSVAACDDGQQAGTGAAPAPSVVVTAVVRKDVTPSRSFVGRVEAIESVELRARSTGSSNSAPSPRAAMSWQATCCSSLSRRPIRPRSSAARPT